MMEQILSFKTASIFERYVSREAFSFLLKFFHFDKCPSILQVYSFTVNFTRSRLSEHYDNLAFYIPFNII